MVAVPVREKNIGYGWILVRGEGGAKVGEVLGKALCSVEQQERRRVLRSQRISLL